MKSPVTIEATATITVPQKHWPKIRRALQTHHHGRYEDYGESFRTTTHHCNLFEVAGRPEIKANGPRRAFWLRVRMEMPLNFTGNLVFQIEP